jgi:hypothetical protein
MRTKQVVIVALFFFLFPFYNVYSIGYGGIGGEPAYPREDVDRSRSIFIHTLPPGAFQEEGVRVINNTEEEKRIRVYSVDSEIASGGKFACRQFSDEKESVGKWISVHKKEVSLSPKTNVLVSFSLSVPDTVSPGEHNGCIVLEEITSQTSHEPGVRLHFRTGIRVAITVPGEITQEVVSLGFSVGTQRKEKSRTVILATPIIKNRGNVSADTNVSVSVRSPFGTLIHTQESSFSVPKGEVSHWNFEMGAPFWGGVYKVDHSISYREKTFFTDESSENFPHSFRADTSETGPTEETSKGVPPIKESAWLFVFPAFPALIVEVICLFFFLSLLFLWFIASRRRKWIKHSWEEYSVLARDDIKSLAKKRDVSWKLIAKANRLKPPYILRRGMSILLPPEEEKSSRSK